ncbi:hypothetical protein D3C76_263930 [compost metagenome]
MKTAILIAMLATSAMVLTARAETSAQPPVDVHEGARSQEETVADDAAALPVKSRQKRGVAPVVGMPCEEGHKLLGDDCVVMNVTIEE